MKKIFQWAMAAALICGISFAAASCSSDDDNNEEILQPDDNGANSSSDEIGYIECSWDGTKVVKTPKVVVAKNLADYPASDGYNNGKFAKSLEEGVYYVSGKLEMRGAYLIDWGTKVDIILCDGAEMSLGYITVDGLGSRLRIFGQDKGTGKLTLIPGGVGNYAGIGTYTYGGCDLEFHGGNIVVQGPDAVKTGGPGIGCGTNQFVDDATSGFNSIIIYDGTINAKGGNDAAGIGNNQYSPNGYGDIYIYGGNVTAQGGEYAAGIGGGDNKKIGSINIYGGTVTAYSGVDGAGIGGGEDGDSGDINIYGGTVRAYGYPLGGKRDKSYGAGIGGGQDGNVNIIKVYGGDVKAYGGMDAAGIGTGEEFEKSIWAGQIYFYGGDVYAQAHGNAAGIGAGEDADCGKIEITGGTVHAHGDENYCGNWTGAMGAFHEDHRDNDWQDCKTGKYGWGRIYIGKCMRLHTWTAYNGYWEHVSYTANWWDYVHGRSEVIFEECNHVDGAYDITNCPYCHSYTLQLK